MQEDLKKLGLTDNEIKVYLSVLALGETAVGAVVKDLGVHRQIAYDALESLEKKGMILKTKKNNIFRFKLANPRIIWENEQKKALIAKRISENITLQIKSSKREHEVDVFEGVGAINQLYLNNISIMPRGGTYYVIAGAVMDFQKTVGRKFFEEKYERLRRKNNLSAKIITGESKKEEIHQFGHLADMETRSVRYLPWEYANPISTVIWQNSLSMISYVENQQFAVEIKNRLLRDAYLEHFEVLWRLGGK